MVKKTDLFKAENYESFDSIKARVLYRCDVIESWEAKIVPSIIGNEGCTATQVRMPLGYEVRNGKDGRENCVEVQGLLEFVCFGGICFRVSYTKRRNHAFHGTHYGTRVRHYFSSVDGDVLKLAKVLIEDLVI